MTENLQADCVQSRQAGFIQCFLNKNIKSTQTQLKDVEKLLKLDPKNTELLSQKQKLLADSIATTKEKLTTLKTAAEQANTALANGEISQEQYDALQREIIETEQELRNLETEAGKASDSLKQIGEAGEILQNVGDKIFDVGATLTTKVTVPIAAAGTAAVKTASDFDSAMSKVAAVSGATGDDLEKLRDKAREMGSKTKFSASEAAEAMNYMAMAGWKTGDMLSGIDGIMNLAAASGEDLATTSDIVTDALTAFGLSAADSGHFADVLASASSNANTNVSMLGESFKYCAPIAGALGFSCEDTAEALGLMANAGIKSTQSGTSMRSIMTALSSEVKFCSSSFGEMEIATSNADGSMRDLSDILADCRVAFDQMSESEKASAAQALVGKNAMSGFLALMNAAPQDVEKLSSAIANCDGTSLSMAETMQDNLGGQLTILKSQLEELAISFGEILMPVIRSIVTKIQEFIDKLNAMDPATKETIVKVALVAAAMGPLLVVIGKVISSVGSLMTFISKVPTIIAGAKTAFSTLGAAIGGISAPVVAVIAIVAVLVAAFVNLWNTNEDFKNSILSIWEQIKATFERLTSGIVDRINALGFDFESFGELVKAVWNGLCEVLAPLFEGVFQHIADIFSFVTDTILSILDIFIGLFTGDWDQCWNGIKDLFTGIWDFIVNSLSNILNTLTGVLDVFLGWFGTSWDEVWTAIKDFFIGIWDSICSFFQSIADFFVNTWNAISSFFTGIVTAIHDTAVSIFTAVYDFFAGILTSIHDFFSTIFNAIWTVISTVCTTIYNTISSIWNTIYEFISPLLEALKYLFETIFQAIHIIISNVMDWISEKIQTIWNAIVEFITPLLEGIKSFFETIWNAISTAISTVMSTISNIITTVWNAISGFISSVMNTIKSVISSIWNTISGAISGVVNGIRNTISSVWNSISSTISSVMNTIRSTVTSIWNSVKSAISNTISGIYDTIKSGFDKAVNFVKGLASDAFSWGSDIISGIVDGIKSCISWISDACTDVADTIRSYLHFSVPDVGPLTEYESWMPDFMQGLADGIIKSKKVIAKAVSGVADTMKIALNTDLSYKLDGMTGAIMNGGIESSVVNNYYNNDNSRTVNQTNNSPKSLSRLEIYRQTKNAVKM
ncbi:MAG: phage tail tape measure protein [Ruminococcus callidus]|uniref:phage tail tape measure protein n=1 Tax=Ruminococcus callidus TaxID=40519 RepID=UPI002E76011C|nr:phage tail tape measure protein [Ruminococcus callidus]MEE0506382.1 phage tail tape measure protein [Ruminococcus callidus]